MFKLLHSAMDPRRADRETRDNTARGDAFLKWKSRFCRVYNEYLRVFMTTTGLAATPILFLLWNEKNSWRTTMIKSSTATTESGPCERSILQ